MFTISVNYMKKCFLLNEEQEISPKQKLSLSMSCYSISNRT